MILKWSLRLSRAGTGGSCEDVLRHSLAADALARAYGDDEPDYSAVDLREARARIVVGAPPTISERRLSVFRLGESSRRGRRLRHARVPVLPGSKLHRAQFRRLVVHSAVFCSKTRFPGINAISYAVAS